VDVYHAQRQWQVEQFERWLKLMYHRAHVEHHGSCFIVFDERGDRDADDPSVTAVEAAIMAILDEAVRANVGPGSELARNLASIPTVTQRQDPHEESRFVQFSFEKDFFCVDLPEFTLTPHEAQIIERDRSGFFYLDDRPQWTLHKEDVEGHDPLRKIYIYGDERSAAEDMAYIFFDLWKFPTDWQFYVHSSSFPNVRDNREGKPWEKWVPLQYQPLEPKPCLKERG
jgi:hypothetical protein